MSGGTEGEEGGCWLRCCFVSFGCVCCRAREDVPRSASEAVERAVANIVILRIERRVRSGGGGSLVSREDVERYEAKRHDASIDLNAANADWSDTMVRDLQDWHFRPTTCTKHLSIHSNIIQDKS